MRRKVVGLVSIALGALGVFLGACSSSNNTGSGTASTATDFESQYCSFIASCCGAESYPSDGKQCRALLAAETSSAAYNEQAGNACIAAVQAASQKDPAWCVDGTSVNDTNRACDPVFGKSSGGGVQPGGTCQSDSDCAAPPAGDEVTCRDYFSSGASTHVCQVLVPGKAGDGPCIGTESQISGGTETSYNDDETQDGGTHPTQGIICRTADGVTCESTGGTSTPPTCIALAQVGDSCTTGTGQCIPTAYCDFTSGNCAARIATGQACSSTNQQSCVDGDYCDSTTSNCTAELSGGATCTTSQQCASDDCTNGKCGAGLGSLTLGIFCGNPVGTDGG